jgi:hypothetical protein
VKFKDQPSLTHIITSHWHFFLHISHCFINRSLINKGSYFSFRTLLCSYHIASSSLFSLLKPWLSLAQQTSTGFYRLHTKPSFAHSPFLLFCHSYLPTVFQMTFTLPASKAWFLFFILCLDLTLSFSLTSWILIKILFKPLLSHEWLQPLKLKENGSSSKLGSTNNFCKVFWDTDMLNPLCTVYGCFCVKTAEMIATETR